MYRWTADCCDACGMPPRFIGSRSKSSREEEDEVVVEDDDDQIGDRRSRERQQRQELLVCQRCKCYVYHDTNCQRRHWKEGRHKHHCKILHDALQPLIQLSSVIQEDESEKGHSNRWWWKNDDNYGSQLDRKDIDRIWTLSVKRWNEQQDYVQAMMGFQQALQPASKAWTTRIQASLIATNGGGRNNGSDSVNNEKNDKQQESMETSSSADVEYALKLAQRLLFCAYCEADCHQMESSRSRLVQCLSILIYLRKSASAAADAGGSGSPSTFLNQNNRLMETIQRQTTNDAWMELMLSYDEEPELRRLSRHVVHLAIASSKNDDPSSWCCGWVDALQRPGYMARLDYDDGVDYQVPSVPFLSRQHHPGWCAVIEDYWETIFEELSNLVLPTNPNGSHVHRGVGRHNMTNSWTVVGSGDRGSGGDDHRVVSAGGKWTEYVLFGTGAQPSDQDAPFTKKLLRDHAPDAVSLATEGGGEVIFSRLAPKTHIEAHCGPTNFRLTCHLGLVVPNNEATTGSEENDVDGRGNKCGVGSGKCQIRVGHTWHSWQRGKVIVFDDSWEHEVLNDTDDERIVLLLRFWHPSLKRQQHYEHHLERARQGKESAVSTRYHPPN